MRRHEVVVKTWRTWWINKFKVIFLDCKRVFKHQISFGINTHQFHNVMRLLSDVHVVNSESLESRFLACLVYIFKWSVKHNVNEASSHVVGFKTLCISIEFTLMTQSVVVSKATRRFSSVLTSFCTYNKSFHYISKQTSCLHWNFSIKFRNAVDNSTPFSLPRLWRISNHHCFTFQKSVVHFICFTSFAFLFKTFRSLLQERVSISRVSKEK